MRILHLLKVSLLFWLFQKIGVKTKWRFKKVWQIFYNFIPFPYLTKFCIEFSYVSDLPDANVWPCQILVWIVTLNRVYLCWIIFQHDNGTFFKKCTGMSLTKAASKKLLSLSNFLFKKICFFNFLSALVKSNWNSPHFFPQASSWAKIVSSLFPTW